MLNIIKSLVKKCADTIRNSTIEMNNKILYDLRNYQGEEFNFAKNNLQINCDKINDEKIEIFLAKGLSKTKQDLDLDEFIEVEEFELDELTDRIFKGEIMDSKTVSAIMTYAASLSVFSNYDN